MEIRLLKNRWWVKYLWANIILVAVIAYFIFSVLFLLSTGINITIPCIWKTFFDFNCPGCGLTRAFTYLIKLDIPSSFYSNPLLFIILPAGIIYFIVDLSKFKKKYNSES